MGKICRVAGMLLVVFLTAGLILSCRKPEPPSPPADPEAALPAAAVVSEAAAVPVTPAVPLPASVEHPYLKLVEADAFFYLGMRDWKALEIFDFIQTARRLRIVPRIKEMLEPELARLPERPGANRRLRDLAELRDKISLRELLGGEFVLALFPGLPDSPPIPALIARLPEGKAELYGEYFRELTALARREGEEAVESETIFLGQTLISFSLPDEKVRATWCRVGDTLIAAAGRERTEKIVSRLLAGEGDASLAEDPAFRESFQGMDLSARGVFYLRVKGLTGMIAAAARKAEESGIAPSGDNARFYLRGLRKAVDTVETVAGVADFGPGGFREQVRFYLDEENGSQALLDLVKMPPRRWEVLDYIPEGSAEFTAGFLAPEKVYRPLLKFIAAGAAPAAGIVDLWEEEQVAQGIRVEEDLLSWLGDEYAFCTVSLSRSLFEPGGWAAFFRFTSVGDLDRFLAGLLTRAEAENLNVVAEEYGGIAFNVLYLPIPLLPITPVAGRVGEFLVLASRRDVFTGIVDVYSRTSPGIRKNPDFQRLERELGSAGSVIYFSRCEDKIEAMITFLRGSASLVGMLLPPPGGDGDYDAPSGPDSRQVTGLINDFTRVLEDLKIFHFRAGISRYRDGYIEFREVMEIGK